MADHWLGISSAEYDSSCGDTMAHYCAEALDGTDYWYHASSSLPHWFILDLADTYTIKKLRGRSNSNSDPIDIDVYVSDSKTVWGSAVATEISTWKDTDEFVEFDSIDKNGRYIKVAIRDTENVNDFMIFGGREAPFTIFDAYGDVVAPPPVPANPLIGKPLINPDIIKKAIVR